MFPDSSSEPTLILRNNIAGHSSQVTRNGGLLRELFKKLLKTGLIFEFGTGFPCGK